MPAGAKALYEDFVYRILRTEPGKAQPWEELTQKQHEQWAQMLKTGIKAALQVKAAKTSAGGSKKAWWSFLSHYP
jgi:hypothetical protein